jgi:hypothetical protein
MPTIMVPTLFVSIVHINATYITFILILEFGCYKKSTYLLTAEKRILAE